MSDDGDGNWGDGGGDGGGHHGGHHSVGSSILSGGGALLCLIVGIATMTLPVMLLVAWLIRLNNTAGRKKVPR